MKASQKVKEYLQQEARSNVLATSDKSGQVNIAVFGSLRMVDDSSLIIMMGDKRSYTNLRENPFAACLVTLHGKTGVKQEGCRLYLKVRAIEDDGENWCQVKNQLKARVGDAAETLRHLIWFDIVEARPILDMGQGV